jgi:response regulator RpfG family c-di-GMP phosphodiesterase
MDPSTTDAIRILGAVGDVFGSRTIGYSMHVADVAARFMLYREREPEAIAVVYFAAALHRIGAVRVVVPRDSSPRVTEIAGWDDPPGGAAIVAAARVFPRATADAVRWHREAFDGTGFPDQLRWDSIPEAAMTINIARAFVSSLEAQGALGSPRDAIFGLESESGCVFSLAAMREFREFVEAEGAECDAPYACTWPLPQADPAALIGLICADIDSRQARTAGRGDRLERIVRTIVGRLGEPRLDADRAAFAGRLTALARTGTDGSTDDIFTLSRLGLEARAARAQTAARILQTAPSFAAYAPSVRATEEWFDGSGLPDGAAGEAIDPIARVLAVAIAAEALTAPDASRRIAGAGGTRLDPAVVRAYLGTEVAP